MGLYGSAPKQYSRTYGDFRGVDFSSDHTQVADTRFAYLCNMFKDYQSAQGQAVETIPGFRRRFGTTETVHGIHQIKIGCRNCVLIHSGSNLYRWKCYPASIGVEETDGFILPEPTESAGVKTFALTIEKSPDRVVRVKTTEDIDITQNSSWSAPVLTVTSTTLAKGDEIFVTYIREELTEESIVYSGMNEHESKSFIMNNRLHIIDGENYLIYDGYEVRDARSEAFVPTTYINIIPAGENADTGVEYQQRNMLTPFFKHTFVADGTTTVFTMNEAGLDGISEVKVYGTATTAYTANLANGTVTFTTAPESPEDAGYPEGYAGVEITAKKYYYDDDGVVLSDSIEKCTVTCIYDNRVFMSGNPSHPNTVYYCERNDTGYVDPLYFGVLNTVQDGVGNAPITGMIQIANSLLVLKTDTQQDGSVYFHTPLETGNDIQPKTYPSERGLAGVGCLGACENFLDDPVFVSRLGLEAVGQLSVRYERAIEHRSSLVDAKLCNLDLKNAKLCEWNGYLAILVDGKIFLADSRQAFKSETGNTEYEWYYLDGIGVWENQYPEYRYSSMLTESLVGKNVTVTIDGETYTLPLQIADSVQTEDGTEDRRGTVANPADESGMPSDMIYADSVEVTEDDDTYYVPVRFTVHEVVDSATGDIIRREAYAVESSGSMIGGIFKKATVLKSLDDNLFFGTEDGAVCSFNFDKRDKYGVIPTKYYNFDGRTINCGCATKMDNCGIPYLTKTTIKKSTVVRMKSLSNSTAKVKVRSNRKDYSQIARIRGSMFTFDDVDFAEFTFNTADNSIFCVKEKEKKWVEKQYYFFSDEYEKPFALFYISFRYKIAGRYKGR